MAGSSEFDGRIAELQRRVGSGKLRGSIVRDLPYAQYQHERLDLNHPRGGGPKYQESALYDGHAAALQRVADSILSGDPEQAMASAMRTINTEAAARAPKETGELAAAGHVSVSSGGRMVVDEPPQGGGGGNPARDRADRRRRGR